MEHVHVESFKVIGVPVRTSDKFGKSIVDAGITWFNFEKNDLYQKIPNKTSDYIYIVDTDHEEGNLGEYTIVIGCAVSSFDSIPEGMVGKDVPSGYYTKYTVQGRATGEIVEKWKEIWKKDAENPRKYSTDFAIYKGKYPFDLGNIEGEIYIAESK